MVYVSIIPIQQKCVTESFQQINLLSCSVSFLTLTILRHSNEFEQNTKSNFMITCKLFDICIQPEKRESNGYGR